ncbi:MAG: hypothetical protein IT299_04395 [Dehalococcoidia bacterium]|nr:hypothetical protein [Dehalococcoidia bacterium]
MSDSVFSGLKLSAQTPGREQRLFSQPSPTEPAVEGSPAPRLGSTLTRGRAASLAGTPAPSSTRAGVGPNAGAPVRPELGTGQATPSATTPRRARRYSHDIYVDQARWMSHLKLELEERYGARITANALVQVALDLLRADCESAWEESVVYRTLVRGSATTEVLDEEGRS